MKQVVKVSISGILFTLESDAHQELENYLRELENFYGKDTDGEEIIADIEERIAELLIERGGKERTVSIDTVRKIIALLGHPSEMERNEGESAAGQSAGKSEKKLYRDVNEKVIGGVCSGMGAYFGVDAVMIRLIFVLLFFVSPIIETFNIDSGLVINIGGGSYSFMILLYFLLWVIIPAAKTVEQRCAMRGRGTGIEDMQGNTKKQMHKSGGSPLVVAFCRAFLFFIGALLLLWGFAGLVFGMMLLVGYEIVEGMSLLSVMDYVELGVKNTIWIKLLLALAWFIPFLGMLYGGVMLCFRFNAPKWHPGLILFLVWILSLVGLGSLGVKAVSPYFNDSRWSDDRALPANADTLYINLLPFDGIEMSVKLDNFSLNGNSTDYLLDDKSGTKVASYPQVRIVKHSPEENDEPYHGFVECKYTTYGIGGGNGNHKSLPDRILSVDDSSVAISPLIYSLENKFKGEDVAIWIHVPKDMTVIKRDETGKSTCHVE